jgi:ribosomal protein L15
VGAGLGKPGRPYEVLIDYTGKFSDGQVFDEGTQVSLTLGDEAVPFGLWKAIEHMRKGEKSLIMIKPKHGFGRPEGQDYLHWPKGWESEEQKNVLRKRRLYYIVKLYEWAVKHDLDGDGMLIKNIVERGVGYDRPFDVDEVKIDLKIYQTLSEGEEKVYVDVKGLETLMSDGVNIWHTTKKILQSMKTKERVKTLVRPEYFTARDAEMVEKYGILKDRPLRFDIDMVNLVRVEDVYRDGSAFQKTIFKGEGTASPYSDFQVLCKSIVVLCYSKFSEGKN